MGFLKTKSGMLRFSPLAFVALRSTPKIYSTVPTFTHTRKASGYHIFDTKNLTEENIYTQFNKKTIAIGELIGFVNHLKVLYNKSPVGMQQTIASGCEQKIDTVMEYYCKKGRGDDIREIIEAMPRVGTQQAFMYCTQAYVNANEFDKAISCLDLLEQNKVFSTYPYEIVLHGLSKRQEWDKILTVIDKMEKFGFTPDFETLAKIEGAHEKTE